MPQPHRIAHRDAAIRSLRAAIEQRPEVVDWAREDQDLASLREDSEFSALRRG